MSACESQTLKPTPRNVFATGELVEDSVCSILEHTAFPRNHSDYFMATPCSPFLKSADGETALDPGLNPNRPQKQS